jgi:hypothetical protein
MSGSSINSACPQRFFLQFPQQNRMSSPSTRQNQLNQQKTREIKLPRKWHSSYAPPDKIEDVEIKKTREARPPRRASLRFSPRQNRVIPSQKSSSFRLRSSPFWPQIVALIAEAAVILQVSLVESNI